MTIVHYFTPYLQATSNAAEESSAFQVAMGEVWSQIFATMPSAQFSELSRGKPSISGTRDRNLAKQRVEKK